MRNVTWYDSKLIVTLKVTYFQLHLQITRHLDDLPSIRVPITSVH